jgi:hypothetical protein
MAPRRRENCFACRAARSWLDRLPFKLGQRGIDGRFPEPDATPDPDEWYAPTLLPVAYRSSARTDILGQLFSRQNLFRVFVHLLTFR